MDHRKTSGMLNLILDKHSASSKRKARRISAKVDHREIKYPDFRCVDIALS